MPTKPTTDENFETEVLKSEKPTVVDFWAEWCNPCKQISPVLEEISEELKNDVVIAKHNIDNEPNIPVNTVLEVYPLCYYLKMVSSKPQKLVLYKVNIVSDKRKYLIF